MHKIVLRLKKKICDAAADSGRDDYGQDLPDEYFRVLEHIGKYFEQDISLKRSAGGKGTMTIKFNSDAEVQRFLKALDDAHI